MHPSFDALAAVVEFRRTGAVWLAFDPESGTVGVGDSPGEALRFLWGEIDPTRPAATYSPKFDQGLPTQVAACDH